jgi:hypothetical protein
MPPDAYEYTSTVCSQSRVSYHHRILHVLFTSRSSSNYRAKDRLGLSLIPIAVRLNRDLPFNTTEERCAANDITGQDFARARLSAYWTVRCTDV